MGPSCKNDLWVIVSVRSGRYQIQGVTCKWGKEDSFVVDEIEILDIFVEADFKDGGRFEKGGWFTRDKSNDYLPCMRNGFDEDKKEVLCKKNQYLFY